MGLILGVVAGVTIVLGGARWLLCYLVRKARAQPVLIGDLHLPAAYVREIIWGRYDLFIVPRATDAYGRFWEPIVMSLIDSPETLQRLAADPQKQWPEDESYLYAHAADAWAIDPHFVPYITDFSRLLLIGGRSGRGSSLFLDFRETPGEPSVIYWDGLYWRRVAPDCQSFLALLEPRLLKRHRDWRPAKRRGPEVAGCITVALAAVAHYDIWSTSVMVMPIWSAQNQPHVVLLPDTRDARWIEAGRPDWQIVVSIPPGFAEAEASELEAGVNITTRGTLREIEPDSPRSKLGQVVTLASRQLALQTGGPGLGGKVHAGRLPDNRLSSWGGQYIVYILDAVMILVSEDLAEVTIARGPLPDTPQPTAADRR